MTTSGSPHVSFRPRPWLLVCAGLLAGFSMRAAAAADCPGHPDAIGVSRVLVVDPREHPRIGSMQYPETLPLREHEVVLTFDDGPLPRNSNQILRILADQCVKATFFTIGSQAQANPEGVRKLAAAGHTIGTHSQNHPLTFQKMPLENAVQEIDAGIASVSGALRDPSAVAPFFRIPGLLRAEGVEDYLASKNIQVWSADFLADDWRHISSSRVFDLAMKRLQARGKGILLLHDIQARTVAALPRILREMKLRGYRIVHVVPATPEQPPTPTDPEEWQSHPTSETVPIARWPRVPNFVFAEAGMLPAPMLSDFAALNRALLASGEPFDRLERREARLPQARKVIWPAPSAPLENANALPIPANELFAVVERTHKAIQPLAIVHRAGRVAQPLPEESSPPISIGTGPSERAVRALGLTQQRSRIGQLAARSRHAVLRAPKPMADGKKEVRPTVRVASLKSRKKH
jgi:peptidoglycan-N-acetylglucosamine deacetylase